jgi:tol-pal system protein YbgF
MRCALAALVAATIAAGGCASRGDVKRLRAEVRQLKEVTGTLVARPPAASPGDVDVVSRDVKELSAKVSQLEGRLAESSSQLARIEARGILTERAVQDVGARVDGVAAGVTKLEATVATHAAPPPPAVAAPRDPAPPKRLTPGQTYAAALAMFRAREHGQAVLDLLDFLARYPKHQLAPAAQYWIGEAYFVQRDYRQALVEFEKVLGYGPQNPRAADALLRSGMASKALRDSARAEQLWRRVVEEYPQSEAAQKARTFLSGIGGSPPAR